MEPKENNINSKIDIFKSVKSNAICELTPELLDVSIDMLTKSDVLKDIPVFGIGFKGYSLYKSISESFFTKKLLKFLIELKEIPLLEREEFISQLEFKKETNKAGEKLLITLNRLDDDEKASMIGKLFKYTILGEIEYDDFNRLTYIIDKGYITDLKLLKDNLYLYHMNDDIKINLYQIGLIKQSISDIKRERKLQISTGGIQADIQPKLTYKINTIGSIFIKYAFK